ncbi:MAG: metal-dependent hydrolase [Nanoarchaeota archaeon]
MIFIHLLIGILLGKIYGNYIYFIAGSLIPDIDHLYIILKNRLYNIKKIISSIKYEKNYGLKYKTPLIHSILGLVIISSAVFFFNKIGAVYFSLAYFIHLLIDWVDIDEKYYLYPLKIKFKGFLPIWSKQEKILTLLVIILLVIIYIKL